MEQTFVVLNLSGTAQERSERALAAATAAEKSALNLWAAIGAIVRADGIDALPAFGRNQPTAASYASTLRRAAKLGKLADCFGQRGDAVLIMGYSAVKALLQKAAAPAAPAAPASTPAAPAAAAPASPSPAPTEEEALHVEDVDQPEPVRAGRIIAARRERALHEAAGERADARALEERTVLAVERDVAIKLERAKRALQQIASGRGKAAEIAAAALADIGE